MSTASAQSMPATIATPIVTLSISSVDTAASHLSIPSYLKSPPLHIGSHEIKYLHKKGALNPPARYLRDALIEAYITFIHPTLPILDLGAFLTTLENPIEHGKISLPLFQAIMFAGSAWVDIKLLQALGFLTRKAARKSLSQKAKLLYDVDYEDDRLCLVQTLLLLSLWWESFDEQKDGWYWSGLSLHISKTIGLNQEPINLDEDPHIRKLRRKVWFSCVLRDTLASFGHQRPPRVKDRDFNVAMLTVEDFDLMPIGSEISQWGIATSATAQHQLAVICIERIKLCRIISKILQVAFPEDPVGHIGAFYRKREFEGPAQCNQVNSQALALCEEQLRLWREEVPGQALYTPSTLNPAEAAPHALLVHRAILSLLYFTALLSVHRPSAAAHMNFGKIRYAASQSNLVFMDLYKADIMRLMPATAISCLLPVAISHVHDIRSVDDHIQQEGQRQLEECKQILRDLSDAHIAAEWGVNFLTFIEAQVKRKPRKKELGMMSGEITWNVHTQLETTALTNELRVTDTQIFSNQNPHAVHRSEELSTVQETGLEQTPDYFASMIDFPEMWLDMADVPESPVGTNWFVGI